MLALALCFALAAPPAESGAGFPFPVTISKLKNGLTVARVPLATKGLVAVQTVVRVGSRNEVELGHTGFAHFFEHVMFKGTPTWPDASRGNHLGALGFSENAYTSDDVTVYHLAGPSQHLDTVLALEADRFKNLTYTEETFQTEAKAVLGEYHKNAASPGLKMEETLLAAAFQKHTYRHTTLGFYDDIKAMPQRYAYSKQFFKRWYTPDNTLLVIAGDIDDAQLMASVTKHYGDWAGTAAKVAIPKEPKHGGSESKLVWDKPTQPRILQGWLTPAATMTTKDAAIAQVLGEYLAGQTSPLFKRLVLDEQLAEALTAGGDPHRDPSLFQIHVVLKAEEHRAKVSEALEQTVAEVAGGKVDEARVTAIRSHLRYGELMHLETPEQVAGSIAYLGGVLGNPSAADTFAKQLEAVTPKDLVAFAKSHLGPKARHTLTFVAGGTP